MVRILNCRHFPARRVVTRLSLEQGRAPTVLNSYMTIGSQRRHAPNFEKDSCKTLGKTVSDEAAIIPPLPPRPPMDYECCTTPSQPENVKFQSVNELASNQKHAQRGNRKLFLIMGIFFSVTLIASLLFGVFRVDVGHEPSQQLLQNSSLSTTDLVARIRYLEDSLQHIQVQLQNNTNNFSALITKLNTTGHSLLSRTSALERNLNATTSSFNHDLHSIQSALAGLLLLLQISAI